MQAISLWQPYASLIAAKVKPFETRHWPAQSHRIGQRIAIHAALRRPTQAEVAELSDDVAEALGSVTGTSASHTAPLSAPRS